ncbi:MAG TPA: single-stranded-DNA-specific exonuclease RecJ [bacterium]
MELSWQVLNNHPPEKISQFAQQLNSSPVLARVLLNRGIEDIESARRFFKPNFTNLHDPFLMAGMSEAVKRIETAITKKEKTLIYGDYDVDGTTATSMLMRFFHLLGHSAEFYVPDRLVEGYGLSDAGIQHAHQHGFQLIISVDCGITANSEIALAREFGLDVIVCDHHQPAADLPPATAILNPKRADCPYPFKELAGVGVAFKLIQALQSHLQLDEDILYKSLEFAAIGSSADIVPLVDENRIFVKFGLRRLRQTENIGFRALLAVSGVVDEEIGTGHVVFVIAPRINAVGRLGDAGRAVRLLTTEDEHQAKNIAAILESENRIRRSIDEETFLEAVEIVEKQFDPKNQKVLVLEKEGWHPGVIGIVASRIAERYYRPTVMIATADGKGRGSARSIPGFDIYRALENCRDCMQEFGGHKYAAGLSIESGNIQRLRTAINQVAAETLTPEQLVPKLWIDSELRFSEISADFLKLLRLMAPFGPHNMRPVFLSKDLQVVGAASVVGKNHLRFKVRQDGIVMDAIGFNLGDLLYRVNSGERGVQMVYVIEENEWQGRKSLQLRVKDLR